MATADCGSYEDIVPRSPEHDAALNELDAYIRSLPLKFSDKERLAELAENAALEATKHGFRCGCVMYASVIESTRT